MTTFLIFEKSNKDGILIVNLIKKYFFLVEQKINKEQSQFQLTKVNRKIPKNSHRNIRNFREEKNTCRDLLLMGYFLVRI